MKTNIHFLSYLAHFFLQQEMFQTQVVEKLDTQIICSMTFFSKIVLYEIMWKNTVGLSRPQMTIWRMRNNAVYLRLQIHTLMLYNTHCFSTATMVAAASVVYG